MSDITSGRIPPVGSLPFCHRGGCSLSSAHTIYACVSQQLRRECRNAECSIKGLHTFKVCNRGLMARIKDGTFEICNEKSCTDATLHGEHDCNPRTRNGSKELVPYTGPNLERYSAPCQDAECVITYEHNENQHVLCSNSECPIGGDHLTDRDCPTQQRYIPQSGGLTDLPTDDDFGDFTVSDDLRDNKVTLKMRAMRFGRNLRQKYLLVPTAGDFASVIVMLLVLFGATNTILSLDLLFELATVIDSSVSVLLLNFLGLCAYTLVFVLSLSFCTRVVTFPASRLFSPYWGRIVFGTSLMLSSILVEALCVYSIVKMN